MQQALNKHTPSEKGKEVIAVLFPLSHSDREKSLIDYWKHYPKETTALMDGFHFVIQELVEGREEGETSDRYDPSDEFLGMILTSMRDQSYFFSYSSLGEFFSAVGGFKPDIFANPKKIGQKITQALSIKPKHTSSFNLPDKLDDPTREKVKTICEETAGAYKKTQEALPSIINARKQIGVIKKSPGPHAEMDFKLAKATFQESYSSYEKNAKLISQHWPFVYDAYLMYPDEPIIVQIYIRYLAKLLASRESIYPVENYVRLLAEDKSPVNESAFEPDTEQLKKGISSVALKMQYIKGVKKHIHALESRYRKRKLMVKLKEKTPKAVIIKELLDIAQLDPIDIRTSILIAKLFSEYARTIQNMQKRTSMKEQALKYCNLAFSRIDDFIDLQKIEKINERDQQRAGFVKTITAIRLPLIKRK